MKSFDQLEFTDSFMFAQVLYSRPDLCLKLLELILDEKIDRIEIPQVEKTIGIRKDTKGVRFDVFTQNETSAYDIEMQVAEEYNLAGRSRYYHAMIDMDQLSTGESYGVLKYSYVIFICKNSELPICCNAKNVYRMVSEDDSQRLLGDGTYTVLLNASADLSALSAEMQEFLGYIKDGNIGTKQTELVCEIDKAVQNIRNDSGRRADYMTLEEMLSIERRKGREEGRAEGREEERYALIAKITCLAKSGELPVTAGASVLGLTEKEFQQLLDSNTIGHDDKDYR